MHHWTDDGTICIYIVAENESHEGKRKMETLWPIIRITHTRTRYIYDLYYKREAISQDLYDWLIKEEYADAKYVLLHPRRRRRVKMRRRELIDVSFSFALSNDSLIAKWKKSGYEKLCCARCIQTRVSLPYFPTSRSNAS